MKSEVVERVSEDGKVIDGISYQDVAPYSADNNFRSGGEGDELGTNLVGGLDGCFDRSYV